MLKPYHPCDACRKNRSWQWSLTPIVDNPYFLSFYYLYITSGTMPYKYNVLTGSLSSLSPSPFLPTRSLTLVFHV